jgi:hypothetical protein
MPLGYTDEQWGAMSEEERLQIRALMSAVETRDTNRNAVMAAFGDVQAGQNTAAQQAAAEDFGRAQQHLDLNSGAFQMDAGSYGNVENAQRLATDMDLQTLNAALGTGALATEREGGALAALGQAGHSANQWDTLHYDNLVAGTDAVNAQDDAALSGLTGAAGRANTADRGSLDYLRGVNSGIDPADPINYGPNLQSAAGRATADPNAVASQRYADSLYQNFAGGSQDLGSAAGRARADAQDVSAQRNVLGQLFDEADADGLASRAGGVTADESAIGMQRDAASRYADVAGGGSRIDSQGALASADPRSIQAQYDVLDQLEGRSGAGLTAVERAMMEQARRTEERDRKSAMDAQLRDMRVRGGGGGGAEIGAMLGAQQQTSENRMLQDMLALASAQERAERAQTARASLAGELRGQSFGEAFDRGTAADAIALQNRDTEMDALGAYGGLGTTMRGMGFNEDMAAADASDEMALANRQYGYGALTDAGELASGMRGQGYDEAFSSGAAADAMNVGNRDFRLDALGGSADLSTTMRGQGFDEQFQAGTAGDAMAQYNRSQSLDTQQYNAELQRQQNEDAWNRSMGYTDRELAANEAGYGRDTNVYDAQRDVSGTEYDRATNTFDAAQGTVAGQYGRVQDMYGAYTDSARQDFDRSMQLADQSYNVADSGYDRMMNTAGTGIALTDANYNRGTDYLNTLEDVSDNRYARERDRQSNVFGATELYTGNQRSDQTNVNQAYTSLGGAVANQNALDSLKDDDFDLLDPDTW